MPQCMSEHPQYQKIEMGRVKKALAPKLASGSNYYTTAKQNIGSPKNVLTYNPLAAKCSDCALPTSPISLPLRKCFVPIQKTLS